MVKHSIKLNDYTPFQERYHRTPQSQYNKVRKHLQEMVDIGTIQKLCSPWDSTVVLVRKNDGSLRFCTDLRKLNAKTIKDAYSLPQIEESLDCLNSTCIFTSLDLKSGYWPGMLDKEIISLTAFMVGSFGFYKCVQMPFGLTNMPATFQRLMESCLGDLHLCWCFIYLDDVIIFSKTQAEHVSHFRGHFEKLSQAGLKLKPSKRSFFQTRVSYLECGVSENGIETDPRNIAAIRGWPQPKTVTDI